MSRTRRLHVTGERIRAYSRRGNYHSDPETAAALGLPGLVAQGVQAIGPAYGLLLDEWGDEFLERGEIDVKFVGLVTEDDTVEATVELPSDGVVTPTAIEVRNTSTGHVAAIGTARIVSS